MQNFKLKKLDEFKFLSTRERNEIVSLVAGKNSKEDLLKRISKRLEIGKNGEKFVSVSDILENKEIGHESKLSILASGLSISQRYSLALDLIDLFVATLESDEDSQSKRRLDHLESFLFKKESIYNEILALSKLSVEKLEKQADELEWKLKRELPFANDYPKSIFVNVLTCASKCLHLDSFHFMLIEMTDYIKYSMVFLSNEEEYSAIKNFETNCMIKVTTKVK